MGNANSSYPLTYALINETKQSNFELEKACNFFDSNYVCGVFDKENWHYNRDHAKLLDKASDDVYMLLGDSHTQDIRTPNNIGNRINLSVNYTAILGIHNIIPFLVDDSKNNTFVLTESDNLKRWYCDMFMSEDIEIVRRSYTQSETKVNIFTDELRHILCQDRYSNKFLCILYMFMVKLEVSIWILVAKLHPSKTKFIILDNLVEDYGALFDPIIAHAPSEIYKKADKIFSDVAANISNYKFDEALNQLIDFSKSQDGADLEEVADYDLFANIIKFLGYAKTIIGIIENSEWFAKFNIYNLVLYFRNFTAKIRRGNKKLIELLKDDKFLEDKDLYDAIIFAYKINGNYFSAIMDLEVFSNICHIQDIYPSKKTFICHFGSAHFSLIESILGYNSYVNNLGSLSLILDDTKVLNFSIFKYAMFMYFPSIKSFITEFNLEKICNISVSSLSNIIIYIYTIVAKANNCKPHNQIPSGSITDIEKIDLKYHMLQIETYKHADKVFDKLAFLLYYDKCDKKDQASVKLADILAIKEEKKEETIDGIISSFLTKNKPLFDIKRAILYIIKMHKDAPNDLENIFNKYRDAYANLNFEMFILPKINFISPNIISTQLSISLMGVNKFLSTAPSEICKYYLEQLNSDSNYFEQYAKHNEMLNLVINDAKINTAGINFKDKAYETFTENDKAALQSYIESCKEYLNKNAVISGGSGDSLKFTESEDEIKRCQDIKYLIDFFSVNSSQIKIEPSGFDSNKARERIISVFSNKEALFKEEMAIQDQLNANILSNIIADYKKYTEMLIDTTYKNDMSQNYTIKNVQNNTQPIRASLAAGGTGINISILLTLIIVGIIILVILLIYYLMLPNQNVKCSKQNYESFT